MGLHSPAILDIRGQRKQLPVKEKTRKRKEKMGIDKKGKKRNKGVTGHMVPEWSKYSYTGRTADVADKITVGI